MKGMKERSMKDTIIAAAKFVRYEIMQLSNPAELYPNADDICAKEEGNAWVPSSLQLFMSYLISSKEKRFSLNQCIVQAARPRTIIALIPFGLGVSVEKNFGSRSLLNQLSRHGFCISAEEVLRFKQSAAQFSMNNNDEDDHKPLFVQYVADNIDHNAVTLTGSDTIHRMGIISCSINPVEKRRQRIPRLKQRLKASSFSNRDCIKILPYNRPAIRSDPLFLKPLRELRYGTKLDHYDLLWHCGWFMSEEQLRPHWGGFMQCCTYNTEFSASKSTIDFLPIIDLNPNDINCIYSTLIFVINQARQQKVITPCITFDQPLYWKATEIIKAERLEVVCRLGGFRTLMSILGSIGKVMKGSGLEELFEEVYPARTVEHIMSGKAYARAIRAHTLVESALKTILLDMIQEKYTIDFEPLKSFYEKALTKELDAESILEMLASDAFRQLSEKL